MSIFGAMYTSVSGMNAQAAYSEKYREFLHGRLLDGRSAVRDDAGQPERPHVDGARNFNAGR